MNKFAVFAKVILLLCVVSTPLWAQQSTTGPVPPPGLDRGLEPLSRSGTTVIISGVPKYIWHHGCGPTALGMVVGYWDAHGFPNLVTGDASTMTTSVKDMIAEDNGATTCPSIWADHFGDYACPLDSQLTGILKDSSESQPGGAHASNCVADFMHTSWSSDGLYYGWSFSNRVTVAFAKYVGYADSLWSFTSNKSFSEYSWEWYKSAINGGYPVVFLVDSKGDGDTDHFVTGIGYYESTLSHKYGFYDTWDTLIHWYDWHGIDGTKWGIYDVSMFATFDSLIWQPGDANGDGGINISDVVYLIDYIFYDENPPDPIPLGDVDCCFNLNVSDAVYLVEYIYLAGPEPCEGSDDCFLPVGDNSIDIGCPLEFPVPSTDSVVMLPIYLTSDTQLSGFSLGFHYDSDDIEITSVDLTGSLLSEALKQLFKTKFVPEENQVLIGVVDIPGFNPIPPQDSGLLATLCIHISAGIADQWIDISPVFVPPAGESILSPVGGGSISPQYYDCGSKDIKIGNPPDYVCGDANSDQTVNVSDAVRIINYIFVGGDPPDPIESGDCNCDGTCNISDAVWIINYVFVGGNEPCDTDGDGEPDC